MILGMPVQEAAYTEPPEDAEDMSDPLDVLMAHQSAYDLEQWLNSPFWKACMMMIDEQLSMNQQDLLMGGITERAKIARAEGEKGPLYESDDALRGAILALTEMQDFPEKLRQALEIATELRNQDSGEVE